jgi:hypothetical protein
MVDIRGLLIIGIALTIAASLLRHREPSFSRYSDETSHRAGPQGRQELRASRSIGASNHSGVEPTDAFGFGRHDRDWDYDGGRDLLDDRR